MLQNTGTAMRNCLTRSAHA